MIINIKNNNKEWGRSVKARLIFLGKSQKELARTTGKGQNRLCECLSDNSRATVSLDEVRLIENALMQWELEYAEVKS
jgi:hypothetical protein